MKGGPATHAATKTTAKTTPPSSRKSVKPQELTLKGKKLVFYGPDGFDESRVKTEPPKERIKMDWVYAHQSSYSRLSSSSSSYIPQGANQDGLGVRSSILLFPSLFFLLLLHPPRSESRWTGCTLINPLIPVSLPPPPASPKE